MIKKFKNFKKNYLRRMLNFRRVRRNWRGNNNLFWSHKISLQVCTLIKVNHSWKVAMTMPNIHVNLVLLDKFRKCLIHHDKNKMMWISASWASIQWTKPHKQLKIYLLISILWNFRYLISLLFLTLTKENSMMIAEIQQKNILCWLSWLIKQFIQSTVKIVIQNIFMKSMRRNSSNKQKIRRFPSISGILGLTLHSLRCKINIRKIKS